MTSYISCGCNRVPHSADWGHNGLICYGACNAIAIYNPRAGMIGKILQTLHQHKGSVNTVHWIKSKNLIAEVELLSGSTDGTVIIWSKINDSFEPTATINVGEIITIVNSLYLSNDTHNDVESMIKLLICTGSINGDLKLWLRNEKNEIKSLQTLTFNGKLPIECCSSYLPNSKFPLLAIALEDSSIELFSQDSLVIEESNFVKILVLIGHEDWVRCMDFSYQMDKDVLLISGSQDATIRLWKLSVDDEEYLEDELQQKKFLFTLNNVKYSVILESILSGHEGWIYGVQWHPLKQKDGNYYQPMKLLSCSLDKTMIIWEPDSSTGIWTEIVRVGEVGGNSSGFYGCKFGPHGSSILAHGYQGSFHIWDYSNLKNNWFPSPAFSGHFAEVVDLCWDSKGRFLMSASVDQTTRIHGAWKHGSEEVWHEIGRPQVHGYDMSCLALLTSYIFASGAEEKVVRIFTAPETFRNQLSRIADTKDFEHVVFESATVPALGLTNKATFDNENKMKEAWTSNFRDEEYTPPTEEELMQNTLWPELQKLYGHGYEIFSMAAKHDNSILATACRSTSAEHSAIILWSTKTWLIVQRLGSHQLTVTQMAFSPNDRFLVSVSRDRRWTLFECQNNSYILIAASSKKDTLHSRIIWCCAWTHDSVYFTTGSRDGKIGIWNTHKKDTKDILPVTSLDVKGCSITAICFAPLSIKEHTYILATGYETGQIDIHKLIMKENNYTWEKCITYNTSIAHHLTVKRLTFRPQSACQNNTLQLASCGSDHTVKIYDIQIFELTNT